MSLLKIAKMGNPALHQIAKRVDDPSSPEIKAIVSDMLETLEDSGGIGLAAPQVHIPKRVVIFFVPESRADIKEDDKGEEELTIMMNPEIEPLTDEKELDWEACLSVPDMMGCVPRHIKIRYSWIDLSGLRQERVATGFHARAVQHECDHLDGILYPMRMHDLRLFGYSDEVKRNQELIKAGEAARIDGKDKN